ncbi:helix-turn-helix domain-containing protein [Phytohabitans kaempferiae]|uniref:Helix-turn-helix domain-containing protein n=1 Tax=Phytohabitans kaempferiae TaxID=1620943 RepID=A0ABV6MFG6_9ACTN
MERRSKLFGVELRRRRVEAGYSLDAFAKLVHYSKSHLSKVENGVKGASPDLARLCDAALGCDGALASLVADGEDEASGPSRDEASEVLVYDLGRYDDNKARFLMASRRELFATGLLSAAGLAGAAERPFQPAGEGHAAPGRSVLETFRSWYAQARALGQVMDARMLMPTLVSHAHTLSLFAGECRGADRRRALSLVADYAEYTGWMAQECGDDDGARWWTRQAVRYAAAAGDEGDMAAYALVRYALIAMYQGKADETISAAQRARRARCRPRIRGLAEQREAQGHALANRRDDCFRALDVARELLAADPPGEREAVIGSANVTDHAQAAAGWSLYELGDAAGAAEVLRDTVSRIPAHATRARARFAARQALALATCGRMQEAGELTDQVLDAQAVVRSATVAADLRRLAAVLRRRPGDPVAARLSLRLHESRWGAVRPRSGAQQG